MNDRPLMHEFSITEGWRKIDDFLYEEKDTDWGKAIEAAGFDPRCTHLTDPDYEAAHAAVYARRPGAERLKGSEYDYLVEVSFGGGIELIAVASMPDLIELLAKLTPPILACGTYEFRREQHARWDAEDKRRR